MIVITFRDIPIGGQFKDTDETIYIKHSADTAVMVDGDGCQNVFYLDETVLIEGERKPLPYDQLG